MKNPLYRTGQEFANFMEIPVRIHSFADKMASSVENRSQKAHKHAVCHKATFGCSCVKLVPAKAGIRTRFCPLFSPEELISILLCMSSL
ncbi:MAG: hypothetical protein OXH36_05810, partial [Bdellovibrionales bacterium]|nr:hypothetical protein [Bdellovibrionales bacterium]